MGCYAFLYGILCNSQVQHGPCLARFGSMPSPIPMANQTFPLSLVVSTPPSRVDTLRKGPGSLRDFLVWWDQAARRPYHGLAALPAHFAKFTYLAPRSSTPILSTRPLWTCSLHRHWIAHIGWMGKLVQDCRYSDLQLDGAVSAQRQLTLH
jgi:hypothetical protein